MLLNVPEAGNFSAVTGAKIFIWGKFMDQVKVDYQVTLSDFRRAYFYVMWVRCRKYIEFVAMLFAADLCYTLFVLAGKAVYTPVTFFIALGCIIYFLFLLFSTERGIQSGRKNAGNLIDQRFLMTIDENSVRVQVPSQGIDRYTPMKKLFCVFETKSLFLIYTSGQELHLLPHRAYSSSERRQIRTWFRKEIPDRFSSRFRK